MPAGNYIRETESPLATAYDRCRGSIGPTRTECEAMGRLRTFGSAVKLDAQTRVVDARDDETGQVVALGGGSDAVLDEAAGAGVAIAEEGVGGRGDAQPGRPRRQVPLSIDRLDLEAQRLSRFQIAHVLVPIPHDAVFQERVDGAGREGDVARERSIVRRHVPRLDVVDLARAGAASESVHGAVLSDGALPLRIRKFVRATIVEHHERRV